MQRSDSIAILAASLVKAQVNIGSATKGSENPFFKSAYADLGSVMSACKQALIEQGISILQLVGRDETGDYLETIILHETGEFISERMRLICSKQHDPQSMGSAITYARRYALQSAMFIPAVDDDGEKAMEAIRDDEKFTERQRLREQQAKPIKAQPIHVSDPSDIDKINAELELHNSSKHGYIRKQKQTSGV